MASNTCFKFIYSVLLPGVCLVAGLVFPLHAEKLLPRRILILDFVNQKRDVSSEFLVQSIPDAFVKPLEETKSFEIIDPQKGRDLASKMGIASDRLYDIPVAAALGKKAEADIVIIGNFITIQGTVQMQAKAVEAASERVKVTDNAVTTVSGKLFDGINGLANRMSGKMKAELPPLPEREIVRYQKTNELHVAAYGIYALPLGSGFKDIYAPQFGGYLQAGYSVYQKGSFVFSPVIGGSYLKYGSKAGVFPAFSLQTFSFLGGLDVGWNLYKSFSLHLSGLVGIAISEMLRDFDRTKFQTRDIELRANLEARYRVWQNFSVSLMGGYSHILLLGTDLNGFQGGLGAGYAF